jgi:hypothetical protein
MVLQWLTHYTMYLHTGKHSIIFYFIRIRDLGMCKFYIKKIKTSISTYEHVIQW